MLFTLFRPVYTTTLPERDLYIVLGPTDLLPDILRTKDRDIQIQELQKKGGMYNFETSQNIKILCLLAPENQSEKVAEQARSLEVNTTLYIGESLDRAEIVEAFGLGVYKFEKFLSEPKNLSHAIHGVPTEREEQAHLRIQAIYGARDLVNLPPNEKYPEALTSLIQGLSWSSRTKLRVLDQAAMKKEGMGMIIGVGQWSDHPPISIILEQNISDTTPPKLAHIGKGVTFDSGGIQIKSDTGMHDMKMDMAGAASVIAAFWYLDQIESDIPLVGAVGLVENMTGGSAQKPLDIVRAHNKKTVEIHHTDAEGRLVLGDLVSYVGLTYKPDRICTIATLTGACIHALGFDYAGVSGTDVSYIQKIVQRSLSRPEKLWHLPLDARMRESVKSTIADVKNISSDMKAGSSLGAAFITAFLPQSDTLYVHFDIAGPAYRSKPWGIFPADGTGFGVMTLIDVAQDI